MMRLAGRGVKPDDLMEPGFRSHPCDLPGRRHEREWYGPPDGLSNEPAGTAASPSDRAGLDQEDERGAGQPADQRELH